MDCSYVLLRRVCTQIFEYVFPIISKAEVIRFDCLNLLSWHVTVWWMWLFILLCFFFCSLHIIKSALWYVLCLCFWHRNVVLWEKHLCFDSFLLNWAFNLSIAWFYKIWPLLLLSFPESCHKLLHSLLFISDFIKWLWFVSLECIRRSCFKKWHWRIFIQTLHLFMFNFSNGLEILVDLILIEGFWNHKMINEWLCW